VATAPSPPPAAPTGNVASTQKRVKTKTLDGLKAARMKPARPTYFMLCIGNKSAVAYLAPVVGSSHKTLLRPLMGKDTGLKYHRGQCIYEKGYYTFVGPTVAPGMKRKLELGLLALTGRRFRALVRRGAIQQAKQGSAAELPT
jgi:hypothetical protein